MGKKLLYILISVLLFVLLSLAGWTYGWFSIAETSDANLSASIQRSYFESGTGTENDPYEIRRPIQLYYFSWLQQMGFFNSEDTNNPGNVRQTYFYLSSDIDMQGFTIPAIGTAQYPFVGNFDGNGHVISNLYVHNNSEDFTNEPKAANYETNADQIIGFFGVLGTLDDSDNPAVNGFTYSKSANEVKDFCLDTVMITSETPKDDKTLIGIVAGYVNCNVSGVAVCNSGIFVKSGLSSLGTTLYSKISDYTTVGYCKDEYKNQLQVIEISLSDVLVQTSGSGSSSGSGSGSGGSGGIYGPGGEAIDDTPGNAWGGSINMKNLYSRLYDIYQNRADTSNSYYASETRYQYIGAPELNRVENRSDGGTVSTGFTSDIPGLDYFLNNFAVYDENYDEGALTFSKGLFGNNDYIYLIGEIDENFGENNPYINKYSVVHTLEKRDAVGMYVYSGSNYLSISVTDGTPSIVNKTNKSDASVWFKTSDNRLFTQIDSKNYYLSYSRSTIGLPSLTVSAEGASDIATWTVSENIISAFVINVRRTIFSSPVDLTFYVRYQNNSWALVEDATTTMFITDGTNYLSYSGSGDYLSVSNTTSSSSATAWTYDSTNKTIYTTVNGTQYYVCNNNGVLQIISANVLSVDATVWNTGASDGTNFIKNRIGNVDYAIEYHGGWVLWPSSYYKIHYGAYYLRAMPNLTFDKTVDSGLATNWVFTNGTAGGVISTVINGTNYYLAVTTVGGTVKLALSTTQRTSWTTEDPYLNRKFESVTVYSITTTYNGVKYFLYCENGVWSAVRADANKYVVGYKYSFAADGNRNAIWLSHNMNTGSGDNFTTSSSLETATIFTWDRDSSGYLSVQSGSQRLYLGVYLGGIYSVHAETSTRFYMEVSINGDGEVECNCENNWGTKIKKILSCSGSRFGYGHTYDAIISRPPMMLDVVTGQNINFVENSGNMTLENTNSYYYQEVNGSPKSVTETSVSKLHGTYLPITTVSSTNYITTQRNTGYIVGGSNYKKYGDYSSYRLGDVRVANYDLGNLNSEYFDTETKEIKKVLTSNSYGADVEYDKSTASDYFNNAFPQIQSILQSDGNMYGIHFMDAEISQANTMFAEKAVIEHVSYYDYEMPESSIDFNLMNNGYVNFFAGTYATDQIVGDNNSFFSFYQVFRYNSLLSNSAIVAIYESNGRPLVFKMNNNKYYYYDTTESKIKYIKNIDNIFDSGKSLDDIYLQVTSGVYMDKTNPANTLYYTLRNDVRDGYYYTFNPQTSAFTLHYSLNLAANYVSASDIKEIKQIEKIYSKYTSAGASSLATEDMVYLYYDGTYSRDGVTENPDNSVSIGVTKYNLVFDLNWIDSETELITDAIYYFEIPVTKGEYCLGSVDGGKGAYLLYLDLSTNNGGEADGANETAVVQTKTTKIETYVYPKGISVVESSEDFTDTPDYETIGISLASADSCTITRTDDNITITSQNREVIYLGYGLSLGGTLYNLLSTNIPYKTTVITDIMTTVKKSDSAEPKSYVQSNASVVFNERVTLNNDSILAISASGVLEGGVDDTEIDTPVIDLEIEYTITDIEISDIAVNVVNTSQRDATVKLDKKESNLSYTVSDDEDAVKYTLTLTPASLINEGDVVTVSPSP